LSFQSDDAHTAFMRVFGDDAAHWDRKIGRFKGGAVDLSFQPKFVLPQDSKIFCIGSCFARNIEEFFILKGFEVLSKRACCPIEEWPNRPNGYLNKFTTHAMVQDLEWLMQPPEDFRALFCEDKGGWLDLQLSPGMVAVPLERCLERRRYVTEDYFPRIARADLVVLTLGLNEVWRDDEQGVWLNGPPSWYKAKSSNRYSFHSTDVPENLAQLERFRDIVKSFNPDVRVLVTVSPVPMSTTFSGRDIGIANTLSKSVLRAAAEAFCRSHDDVDYFPSFEMVTLRERATAYEPDCLHVLPLVVRDVVGTAIRTYFDIPDTPFPHFFDPAYLRVNPDVDRLVRAGELDSGYHHWVTIGKAEGRPLGLEGLSELIGSDEGTQALTEQ